MCWCYPVYCSCAGGMAAAPLPPVTLVKGSQSCFISVQMRVRMKVTASCHKSFALELQVLPPPQPSPAAAAAAAASVRQPLRYSSPTARSACNDARVMPLAASTSDTASSKESLSCAQVATCVWPSRDTGTRLWRGGGVKVWKGRWGEIGGNLQSWPTSQIMTPAARDMRQSARKCKGFGGRRKQRQQRQQQRTCACIDGCGNFRFDGGHAVERPHMLLLLQRHDVGILLRGPLLQYVLCGC